MGEKYGGVIYWDIEVYVVLFYLVLVKFEVIKNLLKYCYN